MKNFFKKNLFCLDLDFIYFLPIKKKMILY